MTHPSGTDPVTDAIDTQLSGSTPEIQQAANDLWTAVRMQYDEPECRGALISLLRSEAGNLIALADHLSAQTTPPNPNLN